MKMKVFSTFLLHCARLALSLHQQNLKFLTKKRNIMQALQVGLLTLCIASCQFDRSLIKEGAGSPQRIVRYDRIVDDYVSTGNIALWQKMNTEFPRETRALIEDVLRLGRADQEGIEDSLRAFYNNASLVKLRKDVAQKFEDLSSYEKELQKAFSRLDEESHTFVVPRIYAQNSAFNQSIVVGDSLIGISLDKYLGTNYPTYKKYFYENQRATMEPSRIVQDCLFFYLNQQFPLRKQVPQHTLGGMIIHQGKIGWVVAQLINSDPIDVAAVQPATKHWYVQHEDSCWNVLRQPATWLSTDSVLRKNIVLTATAHPYFKHPHSRGVGLWVGMRIVDSYMRHHPEVSLDSLLRITDYQRILKDSKYLQ